MKMKYFMVMVFNYDDNSQYVKFFNDYTDVEKYRMDCECNNCLAQVYGKKIDEFGNSVYEYIYA